MQITREVTQCEVQPGVQLARFLEAKSGFNAAGSTIRVKFNSRMLTRCGSFGSLPKSRQFKSGLRNESLSSLSIISANPAAIQISYVEKPLLGSKVVFDARAFAIHAFATGFERNCNTALTPIDPPVSAKSAYPISGMTFVPSADRRRVSSRLPPGWPVPIHECLASITTRCDLIVSSDVKSRLHPRHPESQRSARRARLTPALLIRSRKLLR